MYDSEYPEEDLKAYCGTYLQQEIAEEGAARKIDAFSRFLRTAALYNGEQVNYEAWASDAAVPARTIREYFSVLEDTLLGEMLTPWTRGKKRKAVSAGKFFFFDLGVRNTLASVRQVNPGTDAWGKAMEHFVYTELRSWLDYSNDGRDLSFWRTRDNREVDFIIGDDTAIEVKASSNPSERHVKNLLELKNEGQFKHLLLVCSVDTPRRLREVEILPLKVFLQRLWEGEYS
ncbi:MAG: ATP-binding protein [Spirochaetia bacterium]